ncbi:hypothetical protein F4779DRAFT_395366 [Xylariaceae sp. FL0662B]|nr:hypothetical protein F4779DRAFT_395366 [Xylariaceae sp. FL0662B]
MAKKKKSEKIVRDWGTYFGSGDLSDWQRLMADLGFSEEFRSKSQCRKALGGVWVNIRDFLDDVKAGRPPRRFKNEYELANYSRITGKIYPRKFIQDGSPICRLLAHIFS